ncbi:hypothetical protein [uncultured Flavobacterium sp.]|uniref:hypothetical protein n=1 Tax=uncultured Flavobacterium sp. TaxID=165435 RepID=UPI0027E08F8D|nr:hypothetical protein [uncultured Flavobacterium sp.]
MSSKKEKPTCETCHYFDNSHHVKDERTKHAGLCKKWCEITFCRDSCKEYFNQENDPIWLNLIKPKEEKSEFDNQLTFFNHCI